MLFAFSTRQRDGEGLEEIVIVVVKNGIARRVYICLIWRRAEMNVASLF